MAINIPSYFLNSAEVAARQPEVPDADFAGGMNLGASNACGIGINTGDVNPKLTDWSVIDQFGDARTPQASNSIGGIADPIRAWQDDGADINDTMAFSVADVAAVADAIYDTVSGALNKTGATVAIGDRIWGPIPVA